MLGQPLGNALFCGLVWLASVLVWNLNQTIRTGLGKKPWSFDPVSNLSVNQTTPSGRVIHRHLHSSRSISICDKNSALNLPPSGLISMCATFRSERKVAFTRISSISFVIHSIPNISAKNRIGVESFFFAWGSFEVIIRAISQVNFSPKELISTTSELTSIWYHSIFQLTLWWCPVLEICAFF